MKIIDTNPLLINSSPPFLPMVIRESSVPPDFNKVNKQKLKMPMESSKHENALS